MMMPVLAIGKLESGVDGGPDLIILVTNTPTPDALIVSPCTDTRSKTEACLVNWCNSAAGQDADRARATATAAGSR